MSPCLLMCNHYLYACDLLLTLSVFTPTIKCMNISFRVSHSALTMNFYLCEFHLLPASLGAGWVLCISNTINFFMLDLKLQKKRDISMCSVALTDVLHKLKFLR